MGSKRLASSAVAALTILMAPADAMVPQQGSAGCSFQSQAWQAFVEGSEASRLQALTLLAQERQQLAAQGPSSALAQCWELEGLVLFALGRYRDSNTAYGAALAILRRLGTGADQARLQVSLAMGHLNLSELAEARTQARLAAERYEHDRNPTGLANALSITAQIEAKAGASAAAISTLERVLTLQSEAGSISQQQSTLESIAVLELQLGQVSAARRSLERRQALGPAEPSMVETVLQALERKARPEDLVSVEALNERIAEFRSMGDRTNLAASLETLATIEINRGQLQQGLAHEQEALALFVQQGMLGRAADAQRSVGQTLTALGDYGGSLQALGRALQMAQEAREAPVEMRVLLDLAELQASVGALKLARTGFLAALTLAEQQQDRFRQAQALSGLADLHRRFGQADQAVARAEQALAIPEIQGVPVLEASALSTLVRAREHEGNLEAAWQGVRRIQSIGRQSGDRWIQASAQAFEARIRLAQGQPAAALIPVQQALAVFEAQHQWPALSASLDVQARALERLGRRPEALKTYERQEELCRRIGDQRCQAEVLYRRSRTTASIGQGQTALALIERSLAITESLRATLPSPDLRQSYFAEVQAHYDWWIALLMQQHRAQPTQGFDRQALEISERARARGLLELLSAAQADLQSGADPQLLRQRRELNDSIRQTLAARVALQRLGSDPQQPDAQEAETRAQRLTSLEAQLASLQEQLLSLDATLREGSPRYAELMLPRTLDHTGIRALLDPGTLMLVYHLGEAEGTVWRVSAEGIESDALPARDRLQSLVAGFRAALLRGEPEPASGQELSQILLGSARRQLQGKRLVIVPHGALTYLPFAALPAPGSKQLLLDEHELINLPSASSLAVMRGRAGTAAPAAGRLLVLADPVFGPGDPRLQGQRTTATAATVPQSDLTVPKELGWQRLPGTAMEAEAIQSLAAARRPARLLLGLEANRSQIVGADLRGFRILHFATHGQADAVEPERSRLILSAPASGPSAWAESLRLNDIYNLDLKAELVVLSACQSGLGTLVRGEGLVGLTRGFMHAGARSVVASLWNVSDDSTAALMRSFYQHLLNDGLSPAAALRRAQLELRAFPAWASPYHWAAFVLSGDWQHSPVKTVSP